MTIEETFEFAQIRFDKLRNNRNFINYVKAQYNMLTKGIASTKIETPVEYLLDDLVTIKMADKMKSVRTFMLNRLQTDDDYCRKFMGFVNTSFHLSKSETMQLDILKSTAEEYEEEQQWQYVTKLVGTGPYFSDTNLSLADAMRIVDQTACKKTSVADIKHELEATFRGEFFYIDLIHSFGCIWYNVRLWKKQLKLVFHQMRKPIAQRPDCVTAFYRFQAGEKLYQFQFGDEISAFERFLKTEEKLGDEEMFVMDMDEEEKTPDAPKVFDATKRCATPFVAECPHCNKIVVLPWGQHTGTYTCGSCSEVFEATHSDVIV